MWKVLCQSVSGSSHERGGQPCQDYCTAAMVPLADQKVLVVACADGAGSAELSHIGSRIACETIVDSIAGQLRAAGHFPASLETQSDHWAKPVHEALAEAAGARGVELRQLASTLLFAVIGERGAAFGQIGDGAIVARIDDRYDYILWPQAGEYVNTTFFITDPQFELHLKFAWHSQPVDEVALFTDGLQTLALDFQNRQVHGPFFAPMFDALRSEPQPERLIAPLREFLESPAVLARTDDDKTLVLATRLPR